MWCLRKFQNYFQYFYIIQGLTAHWYDGRQGRFQRNTLSRMTVFAAHSVGLALLTRVLYDSLALFKELEKKNPLMAIMSGYKYVQGVMIVYTIIHIWRYDAAYTKLKSLILVLEKETIHNMEASRGWKYKFEYLKYLKYVILSYIYLVNMLIGYGSLACDCFIWNPIFIVFYANLQMLPFLVLHQYFQMIWKICRCFCYIDVTIVAIAQECDKWSSGDFGYHSRLYHLLQLHSKLCRFLMQLKIIFKWQLLICRANIILFNLMAAYSIFLFLEFIKNAVELLSLIGLTYFCYTLYLYITDYMSEMTSSSFGDLNMGLKEFNVLRNVSGNIEKAVSFDT